MAFGNAWLGGSGIKSVQSGTISLTGTNTTATATITAVSNKAQLEYLGESPDLQNGSQRPVRIERTNATTITATRYTPLSSSATTVSFEITDNY
jgi:hypothetical protein